MARCVVLAGFIALLFGVALPAGASDDPHTDVVVLLRQGQARQALERAQAAAESGDVWAMDVVGVLYLSGSDTVPRDYIQALRWFRKASDAGHGDSMSRVGEMYFNGWGVERDVAHAIEWYRRGVDVGSAAAMNNLGVCLLQGDGVPRDQDAGLALIRRAADTDLVAKENLAGLLRRGEAGPADPRAALPLYEASAAYGSGVAMMALAQMYFSGEGTPVDLASSCRWAAIAYTKGRPDAAAHLSGVCRPRLSPDVFKQVIGAAPCGWISIRTPTVRCRDRRPACATWQGRRGRTAADVLCWGNSLNRRAPRRTPARHTADQAMVSTLSSQAGCLA